MDNVNLRCANCCGNCLHSNKPKVSGHEAVYNIAKTQRWCYLNEMRTTREATCDKFELDEKHGGLPAIKRVMSFNKRRERIKKIIDAFGDREITINQFRFKVIDNWLYYDWVSEEFPKEHFNPVEDDTTMWDKYYDKIEKELKI